MIWHLYTLWIDHHNTSLVTVTIQNHCNIIDYIYYPVHYIPVKCVPLNLLHLFHPPSYLPPLWWSPLLWIYESVSVLLCLFTCFVFQISHTDFTTSLNLWVCFCFVMFVHLFCFSDFTFHIQISHSSEIIWYSPFSVWLISFSIIHSRFIHVIANGKISFFLMAE